MNLYKLMNSEPEEITHIIEELIKITVDLGSGKTDSIVVYKGQEHQT